MTPIYFALYALAAIVFVTVALLFGAGVLELEWCRAAFRAWDRFGGEVFGGDGKHSISAYCGRAQRDGGPWALRATAVLVDFIFGKGHCRKAADAEFPT